MLIQVNEGNSQNFLSPYWPSSSTTSSTGSENGNFFSFLMTSIKPLVKTRTTEAVEYYFSPLSDLVASKKALAQ